MSQRVDVEGLDSGGEIARGSSTKGGHSVHPLAQKR